MGEYKPNILEKILDKLWSFNWSCRIGMHSWTYRLSQSGNVSDIPDDAICKKCKGIYKK